MKIDTETEHSNKTTKEFISELNEDCWECIFSEMDWRSWLNFCEAFPGTEKMDHEIQNTILILNSFEIIKQNLLDNFYRVKKALIMADLSPSFFLSSRKYLRLNSLETLIVTYIKKPIDFISSTKLKKLMVTPFQGAILIDFVEPVLKLSTELKMFKYFFGVLETQSLLYLKRNPLKELYLYDVAIPDKPAFTDFLSNNIHLTHITLLGNKNKNAQICLFSKENKAKSNIKYLKFTIQERLLNHYDSLNEFTNLKKIIIHHRSYILTRKIFELLLNLENLTEIQLMTEGHCYNQENILHEMLTFDLYEQKFRNKNVKFHEFTYPLPNEKINGIRI